MATTHIPEAPDIAVGEVRAEQRTLMQRVFGLLTLGLLLSAAVSYWAATDPGIVAHASAHPEAYYILFCLEVAVIGVLSKHYDKLSVSAAAFAFFLYAAINGISFIVFFLWIPATSVAWGFLLTACTFAGMYGFGYYTRRDLGRMRNIARFAIAGLAFGIIANLVAGNRMPFWATPYFGVTIFASLLIHHADDIRDLEYEFDGDESRWKSAFAGALLIYLDFVNLYILITRLIDRFQKEEE
jgi:FtsH-binding integral membrane protein